MFFDVDDAADRGGADLDERRRGGHVDAFRHLRDLQREVDVSV